MVNMKQGKLDKIKSKDIKSRKDTFLNLALLSFLGLGMEVVIIVLETIIYGINTDEYTYSMSCMHLIYTILVWTAFIVGLIKYSKRKYSYDIMKNCTKPSSKQIAAALGILIVMTIWQYIDWNGIKIIKEFEHNGMLKGILQHIYYFFEIGLVTLIIIFGQKYGENRFKVNIRKSLIPWGGLLLMITWGAVHMLTKDVMVGVEGMIWSLVFGITYLVLRKNTKLTYLFVTLMFIL